MFISKIFLKIQLVRTDDLMSWSWEQLLSVLFLMDLPMIKGYPKIALQENTAENSTVLLVY